MLHKLMSLLLTLTTMLRDWYGNSQTGPIDAVLIYQVQTHFI
jgi:hypothetical protein